MSCGGFSTQTISKPYFDNCLPRDS
jgi:hypothetical protein